jgi:hypothetical protein
MVVEVTIHTWRLPDSPALAIVYSPFSASLQAAGWRDRKTAQLRVTRLQDCRQDRA